ncbi:RNA polymerase factor sigma-54 [Pseudogemmobacter humi]|uniref:RNA polymerase sigma-54 factor n=1 Tax=Pseudogemmobacter humi TaxID=2483812 RepID=A0A3P5XCA1_9RHOB|nr:RNA polymerase sigma-54 factor [Pseudogemmobacter humi]VDC32278.1 RNA polymerase sigma-54 factor 2 [Pseudogemmobacter humi]
MTLTSRLRQSQRQNLGFRQIQALNLLRLSNEELAADLVRRAAANPFLRLRLPAAFVAIAPEQDAVESGLYAHVTSQLRMIAAVRADEALAAAFVEALDGNGWLDRSLADIALSAGRSGKAAAAMLAALQHGMEPAGLFAQGLADCLRLQAEDRGQLTPAMAAVLRHLDLVAEGGAAAVAKASGIAPEAVALCLAQIRRMDPRPGLAFGGSPAPLRAPDVIVSRGADGGWQIALNRATLPVVALAPKGGTGPAMRAVRAEAEWLASIVERRNRTVLAVARAVLQRQRGFLDHGPGALLALSRAEIAAGLGLHDSTVGRVARDLLVETPHGLRTLCSLFDSGPARGSGLAAAAMRHRLGQLIATERPQAPFDDAALAAMLRAEGKPLARRTVAKYREALGIPPCSQRRRSDTRLP